MGKKIFKQRKNRLIFVLLMLIMVGWSGSTFAGEQTKIRQDDDYPTTAEGVVEAFVNADYSIEAIKKYWLGMDSDEAIKEYKTSNNTLYYDCKQMTGNLLGTGDKISESFTMKKSNQNGDKVEILVSYREIAIFSQDPPTGMRLWLESNYDDNSVSAASFILMKTNNIWKIEELSLSEEGRTIAHDFYTEKYKGIEGDFSVTADFPISKACYIKGIKNKIEKHENSKEFVNGLQDCLKAIEEKRNCRAYQKIGGN